MKFFLNGQSVNIQSEGNITISTVNGVTSITTSDGEPREPYTKDVPAAEIKRINELNPVVKSRVVAGSLYVKGMEADVRVRVLSGSLSVDGMNPTVCIESVVPGADLIVTGMNADVVVEDAEEDSNVRVRVEGMNAEVDVPATLAKVVRVKGMNSDLNFH